MAVMRALPDSATVMAMRHTVDVYCWKGIPVARAWPRKARYNRSTAELATQAKMGAVAPMTGAVDPTIREGYLALMGSAHGVTWVDFFRSIAMGGDTWISLG